MLLPCGSTRALSVRFIILLLMILDKGLLDISVSGTEFIVLQLQKLLLIWAVELLGNYHG